MRSALRSARAWLADVLMPTPLVMAADFGLVREATDEQDGDDRG